MTPGAPAPAAEKPADKPAEKPKLKDRLKAIFDEYGPVAIGTYFAIFFVVLVSMGAAVKVYGVEVADKFGWKVDGAAGTAGTWAIAYGITKALQPLRILVTLVLTPLAARLPFVAKLRKPKS